MGNHSTVEIEIGTTITDIAPVASDPRLRLIRVGARSILTLRDVDVETLDLKVGAIWTEQIARAVAELLAAEKARRDALSALGRRAMATAELRQRLISRGHASEVADAIIAEFIEDGWLDDKAFALQFAEEILARSPTSRAMLRSKLEKRGLDAGLARSAASQTISESDELEAAVKITRARLDRAGEAAGSTIVRRIAGALARRGFEESVILAALDRLGLVTDE